MRMRRMGPVERTERAPGPAHTLALSLWVSDGGGACLPAHVCAHVLTCHPTPCTRHQLDSRL